jgi:membrane protein HdeD
MNWQVQTVLAGVLAALGLYVLFNPVSVTSLVAGVVPWLLLGAGAIYLLGVVLRKRLRPITMILPGLVGVFLVYAGLSLKFGDPRTVGPISLPFIFALLLVGGGIAKLLTIPGVRRSRYFLIFLVAGAISVVMGLLVMFNWAAVSAGFLGVVLGLELLSDAAFLAAFAFRDRDKEEHKEALGADLAP